MSNTGSTPNSVSNLDSSYTFLTNTDPPVSRPIKRRQRSSLVCEYCKKRKVKCDRQRPRCSACVRFSRDCTYSVSWFDATTTVSANNKKNVVVDHDNSHNNNSELLSSTSDQSSEEMVQEITILKEKLKKLQKFSTDKCLNRQHLPSIPTDSNIEIKNNPIDFSKDLIDFYQNYSSLFLKNSSHEETKPLNHFTIHKLDHYYAFFTFFFFFYIHVTQKVAEDHFSIDWKTKHPDGGSKWLVLLSRDQEDEQLREFGKRISADRKLAKSAKNNFLFMTVGLDEETNESLKREIIVILPSFEAFEVYLNLYFEHIWPIRPFIDETEFRRNIDRIIQWNSKEGKVIGLNLSQRSDIAVISMLLIILRYSWISIATLNNSSVDPLYLRVHQTDPIPVNFITTANSCLSFYKILKKTTLQMLQSLILLRYYYRDSPEDGDGLTLLQSQQLSGFIVQSALNMGLYRDPSRLRQFEGNAKMIDLRRRLWFGITQMEAYSVILNGAIYNLPDLKEVSDVKYPLLNEEDPVYVAQQEEYIRSQGLEEIYVRISKLVNNVGKTNVFELLRLVNQANDYISAKYCIQDNDPYLKLSNTKRFTRLSTSIGFSNTMALTKMLIQKNVETQIYSLLSIHYETTKYSDFEKYFQCLIKQLKISREGLDLSIALILGKFKSQVPDIHSFHLNPYASGILLRVITTLLSLTLHLYHAQELLSVSAYAETAFIKPSDLDTLINSILQQCDYAIHIVRETLGLKYWLVLKCVCSFKYRTLIMRKHKFSFMENIIDFLDKDFGVEEKDGTRAKVRDKLLNAEKGVSSIIKQWIRIDISNIDTSPILSPFPKRKNLIINMNHTNHLVSITRTQLDRLNHEINEVEFKYIPEFKQLMDLYNLQTTHDNFNHSDPITNTMYQGNTTLGEVHRNDEVNIQEGNMTSTMNEFLDFSNFDFNFLELLGDNADNIFDSLFNTDVVSLNMGVDDDDDDDDDGGVDCCQNTSGSINI